MANVISYEELSSKYKEEYGKDFLIRHEDKEIVDYYRLKFNNLIKVKLKGLYFSSLKLDNLSNVKFKKLMLEEEKFQFLDGQFKKLYQELLLDFYSDYLTSRLGTNSDNVKLISKSLMAKYGLVTLEKAYNILQILVKEFKAKHYKIKVNRQAQDYDKVLKLKVRNLKKAGLLNNYAEAILISRINIGKETNNFKDFYTSAKSVVPIITQQIMNALNNYMNKQDLLIVIEITTLLIELSECNLNDNNKLYDLIFNKLAVYEDLNFETLLRVLKENLQTEGKKLSTK